MAETSGGLRKISLQFTPDQMAWLRSRAARKGGASIAAVIREIVDDMIRAEYLAARDDVDTEQ
jgi:hypothetical protein